jgi:t-SNARE complex subunit (syntaxin)
MKYIEISMKQIQDLVYEQGAIGDRIDWNIESAKSNVTKGNKELDDVRICCFIEIRSRKM